MDLLADAINLTTPALVILAFAAQFIILLYVARFLIKVYPAYKNVLYLGFFIAFVASLFPYYYYAYSAEAFVFFLKSLVSVPLIFFLPGYLAYNAFMKENAGLGLVEVLFLQVLGSVLLSGWVGLVLADLGFFSLVNLDIILLLFCCIIKVKFNVKLDLRSFPDTRINKETLFIIMILLVSIVLFFHPYQWILGNLDQGTYVNTGVNIANTGSIIIHDNLMGNLPQDLVGDTFYVFYHGHGVQYPGFYMTDEPGTVVPQFFYLWPAWIAIFYSIFDLQFFLYITPIFGLLSILGIYFAGKTLFNKNVGLIASLLLLLNFAQIWYSREPMSEMLTMFLFFSGIALFILFIKDPSNKYFGVLSALCIGQDFLTRIDVVYIAIPFMLYFGYLWFYNKLKREYWYFIIPFILIIAHAALNAVLISRPYTNSIFGNNVIAYGQISSYMGVISMGLIIFIILLIIMAKYRKSLIIQAHHFNKYTPYIKHATALLLFLGVIFAYFIRPSGNMDSDSYNLVKLSWYMAGIFGILLATIGFILIMYKRPFNETFIFLSVFLIYSVFYVISGRIDTWQPWWVRRFLPIVIPSAILCIAYLIDWIRGLDIKVPVKKANISVYISIFLVIFLVTSFMVTDYSILNFIQYGGAMEDVNNIAKLTADNSIILYKSNQYTDMIAVPLHYIYGRDVVSAYITNGSVDQMLKWIDENKSVYLLGFDGFSENNSDNKQIINYVTNWTVLQDPIWFGSLNVYRPGNPRIDNYIYTFHILNKSSYLNNLTLLYFNDGDWSDVSAWEKPPVERGINNATMTIYSMNNKAADLTLDVKSLYPNETLQVFLNDEMVGESTMTPDFNEIVLPVELLKGDNILRFYEKDSTQDGRDMSVLNSNDDDIPCLIFRNVTIE